MNKKGDKVLAVYWFAVLILVAGGIFAMVYTFYHHPYDIREIEAEIMINNVADCLSKQGKLNAGLFNESLFDTGFKNNFLVNCHLNFGVEETWEDIPQYYTEINFYDANDLNTSVFEILEGNKNLISSCEIQEEKEYKKEARCVEKSFFSLHEENLYLIKILSIVRKTEKNVK